MRIPRDPDQERILRISGVEHNRARNEDASSRQEHPVCGVRLIIEAHEDAFISGL
jgi:hypothetical protein